MDDKSARHNISFRLNDPKQEQAHKFLSLLVRTQGEFIAELVIRFLNENGITDIDSLSSEDAKELSKYVSHHREKDDMHTLISLLTNAVANGVNAANMTQKMSPGDNFYKNEAVSNKPIRNNESKMSPGDIFEDENIDKFEQKHNIYTDDDIDDDDLVDFDDASDNDDQSIDDGLLDIMGAFSM